MKSESTIRRELRKVEALQKEAPNDRPVHPNVDALDGAAQALAWALGQNAMAPARAFQDWR